jgi:hypothetical protein
MGKDGRWLLEPSFDAIEPPRQLEDCADIFLARRAGKYGYVRCDGTVMIEPDIEIQSLVLPVCAGGKRKEQIEILDVGKIGWFSEGLAPVSDGRRFGYIDTAGKWAIEFSRTDSSGPVSLGQFRGGVAAVLKPGEYVFIDKAGRTIVGGGQHCYEFSEGRGTIEFLDRTKGAAVVDAAGSIIARSGRRRWTMPDGSSQELDLDLAGLTYSEGLAPATSRATAETCFLDLSGAIVAKLPFGCDGFREGAAVIREDWKRFGFVNKAFELMAPMDLEGAESFSNGTAVVKKRGAYFLVERATRG